MQVSTPRNGTVEQSSVNPSPLPSASPAYTYYQKVIASTEDTGNHHQNESNQLTLSKKNAPTSTLVPILTKPGYKVKPLLEELATMSEVELATVANFSVAHPGYGKIEWEGAVDTRSANLDRIVSIESQSVQFTR
jgi:Nucleoporin autopeptidase